MEEQKGKEETLENNNENPKGFEKLVLPPVHPMTKIFTVYLENLEQIEYCAESFIPMAINTEKETTERFKSKIDEIGSVTPEDSDEKISEAFLKIYKIGKIIRKARSASLPNILIRSLYFNLFSTFDAFFGDMLTHLYNSKPELLNTINRSVGMKEALEFSNIQDLKNILIAKEIDSIRRESYADQFKTLENKLKIPFRKFQNWADFVERSQRRNILMHCNGMISEQYLEVCREEGYTFKTPVVSGQKIGIDSKYLFSSIRLFKEVGVKLGQTLWRKCLPEEMGKADSQLMEYIFEQLKKGERQLSVLLTEFSLGLPAHANDKNKRIMVVNACLAYLINNEKDKALKKIREHDWTSTIDDFRMAEAIIIENPVEVIRLMHKIGKQGELVDQAAYLTWPLFESVRKTKPFMEAYKAIYGSELEEDVRNELLTESEGIHPKISDETGSVKENGKEMRVLEPGKKEQDKLGDIS